MEDAPYASMSNLRACGVVRNLQAKKELRTKRDKRGKLRA